MPSAQDLIDWLNSAYAPDTELAWTLWGVGDIMGIAEEENVEMSKERAKEILNKIHYKHDAEIGINWDVIRFHVLE